MPRPISFAIVPTIALPKKLKTVAIVLIAIIAALITASTPKTFCTVALPNTRPIMSRTLVKIAKNTLIEPLSVKFRNTPTRLSINSPRAGAASPSMSNIWAIIGRLFVRLSNSLLVPSLSPSFRNCSASSTTNLPIDSTVGTMSRKNCCKEPSALIFLTKSSNF